MSNIRDLYDKTVIDSIVQNYSDEVDENAEPKPDPYKEITIRTVILTGKTKLFSELFWEPTIIPDLPIPTFKRDDWHEEAQLHIPDLDPCWVWNKPATEQFALAFIEGDTTLLHGLQGTGKTCLPMNWCALLNIPFWRMSCN